MTEAFLIGTHINDLEDSIKLYKLCSLLKEKGKVFFITSHTEVPSELFKKSNGYFYDSSNKVIPYWDLPARGLFNYTSHFFHIKANYIGYGSILNFYGISAFNLFRMGMDFLKRSDYDIIHWIESDFSYNEKNESQIFSLLAEYDSVFLSQKESIAGGRFSFKRKAFNFSLLEKKDEDILLDLSNFNFYTETWVYYNIILGSKTCIDTDINLSNKNKQSDKIFYEWCLFENENSIWIFLYNRKDFSYKIEFQIDHFPEVKLELNSKAWLIQAILPIGGYSRFHIKDEFGHQNVVSIAGENYNKIIKQTEISFF